MAAPTHSPRGRSPLRHPARLITGAFALAVVFGTIVLMLPVARTEPGGASFAEAIFTATSAITVTGLGIVDTATHWSTFGEVVILVLIQLGGLGIMTLASIVLVGLSGRIGLRQRLVAQQEVGVLTLGEVGSVVRAVLRLTLAVEAVAAVVLGVWFLVEYDMPAGRAAWHGLFHAVSAFNNAGFALYNDSLVRFVHDPVVNVVVMVAIVLGGLGVPVLGELTRDRFHWSKWSLHTKLVIVTTGVLTVVAWIAIAFLEWTNTSTLGPMTVPESLLASLFQAVTPRTAGFNTIDYGSVREATLLFTSALMFIGAAPASTGGGIKITTFAMLAFVILSEVRGDRDVVLFNRRIPTVAQRQGLSIALIGVGVVFVTTLLLVENTGIALGQALFEVTSAFGTVGLSTGITGDVPWFSQLLLIVLMFAGRVGPLTVGTALAVRSRDQRFRYPEERPLIG